MRSKCNRYRSVILAVKFTWKVSACVWAGPRVHGHLKWGKGFVFQAMGVRGPGPCKLPEWTCCCFCPCGHLHYLSLPLGTTEASGSTWGPGGENENTWLTARPPRKGLSPGSRPSFRKASRGMYFTRTEVLKTSHRYSCPDAATPPLGIQVQLRLLPGPGTTGTARLQAPVVRWPL